jgi:hypothetical protein
MLLKVSDAFQQHGLYQPPYPPLAIFVAVLVTLAVIFGLLSSFGAFLGFLQTGAERRFAGIVGFLIVAVGLLLQFVEQF